MNKVIASLFVGCTIISCATDNRTETEKKIDDLISKMTIEEKLGQMNLISDPYMSTGASAATDHNQNIDEMVRSGKVGNFLNVVGAEKTLRLQQIAVKETRLGIPLLFGFDVIHGYKTMFPVPLADAASFDMDAVEKSSHYAAIESAANGINWTYAPMIDISRDPRWGRVMEGAGEDVYLTTQVGLARIKGTQGDDLSAENTIAACAKHFVGYGASIAGRDYAATDISERSLQEVYFPPFKAAAEAGVASIMSAFNTVNGEPASTSRRLFTEVLREEWGYDGFVVSDWASVGETIAHGTAANGVEAAHDGIHAGIDMDMAANLYINHGEELLKAGRLSEKEIDTMVRRILKVKFDLGLFEEPYKYSNVEKEKELTMTKESLEASRDVAKKSIVLLKNDNNILPLSKKTKHIAVIGPLADDKDAPLGNWRGHATSNSAVSLVEGIRNAVGSDVKVSYAQGAKLVNNDAMDFFTPLDINNDDKSGFAEALRVARQADVVVMALGEVAMMSGECRSYADINLKGVQRELLREVKKLGKPVVLTLFTGRPLVLTDVIGHTDAILNVWLLGSESGNAIADVLFGDYNPSAKLPMSFPYHLGQVPVFYSEYNTGRPFVNDDYGFSTKYRDIPNQPLYSFGHGLSYTNFEYSEMTLSNDKMTANGKITVSAKITNTGKYDGHEVAQLYVRDLVGEGVARPLIELKGFEKVFIKKGESAIVEFTLTPQDLAFYRLDKVFAPEAGEFEVFVGTASDNLPLKMNFNFID